MTRGDAALPEADYDRSLQRFEDFNSQAVIRETFLADKLLEAEKDTGVAITDA